MTIKINLLSPFGYTGIIMVLQDTILHSQVSFISVPIPYQKTINQSL